MNFSCTYEWQPSKSMYGEPGKSTVGVYVTADDHHGFLHLRFEVNGEPIAQTFELAGKAMRVGGVRWTVKCPESGKMVRDLYLSSQPHAFSFAPCLGPVLLFELAEKTSLGTCQEAYESAWRASGVSRRYVRKTCSGGRLKG